jgi:hypothetical protein
MHARDPFEKRSRISGVTSGRSTTFMNEQYEVTVLRTLTRNIGESCLAKCSEANMIAYSMHIRVRHAEISEGREAIMIIKGRLIILHLELLKRRALQAAQRLRQADSS